MDRDEKVLLMRSMRNVEGKTLNEIGQHFGISRERVRQYIGNTGKLFRKEWTKKKKASGIYHPKNRFEVLELPGVKRVWFDGWGNERHDALSGPQKTGQKFEHKASLILDAHGIGHKMMPKGKFNILTYSGKRIEVKVTHLDASKFKSQIKVVHPTYIVNHLCPESYDFVMVFLPDAEELSGYTYFVIPVEVIGYRLYNSPIRIPWPQMSQKPSKWHEWHERWDLLAWLIIVVVGINVLVVR